MTLTFVVKVTLNVAQYSLHHAAYSPARFEVSTSNHEEMHLQENTLFDLDLGVKVAQNVAQYPLHHVTYLGTKFEAVMSKGLGGDTFTRNVKDIQTDGPTLVRN